MRTLLLCTAVVLVLVLVLVRVFTVDLVLVLVPVFVVDLVLVLIPVLCLCFFLTLCFEVVASYGGKVPCVNTCLLYTSPSPRDQRGSRMPSSA